MKLSLWVLLAVGCAASPARTSAVSSEPISNSQPPVSSDGLTKLIVDPDTRRVLGIGIVGPGAGELIAEGAVAVETALTVEDLAVTIHAHPTLSETLMEAAETLLRPA